MKKFIVESLKETSCCFYWFKTRPNFIPVNSSQINFVYKEVLVVLCQGDQSSQNVTIDFLLILHVKYMFCAGYPFWKRLPIFYTNLHELFCQFKSWTNWVNSGKFVDNCWISCQVMADMQKIYDDLMNINL